MLPLFLTPAVFDSAVQHFGLSGPLTALRDFPATGACLINAPPPSADFARAVCLLTPTALDHSHLVGPLTPARF